MGTDIHWLIERQDADGRWHACMSKNRAYDTLTSFSDEFFHSPLCRLGTRNYNLFGALSDIRVSHADPLMDDLPDDLSKGGHQEIEAMNSDGHSHGCALGTALAARAKTDPDVQAFYRHARQALQDGHCDTVLPDIVDGGVHDDDHYADTIGKESGHEKAARLAISARLLPWQDDAHWRMIVFYDN